MTRDSMVVVGGGLGGLASATYLARAGRRVTLFDKSPALGGRARTTHVQGIAMNLGPHALYRGGPGMRVLAELGVTPEGTLPPSRGLLALQGGELHPLPAGAGALLRSRLFGFGAKVEAAGLLASLPRLDAAALRDVTIEEWLAARIRHPEVAVLLRAFFRLSGYANDPSRQSAGAAIRQLQRAAKANVLYLRGGWQTLVDALAERARAVGVEIVTGRRVSAVEHDERVRGVRLADGALVAAGGVVLAAGPELVRALAPAVALPETHPVRAACLDLSLAVLPRPKARFVLGLDQPLYFSVHGEVIHVARYLAPGDDPSAAEAELEAFVDLCQPGWREVVRARRFLPALTVVHGLVAARVPRAAAGETGIQGLALVGDWVGEDPEVAQLADATLASAREAARVLLEPDARAEPVRHLQSA